MAFDKFSRIQVFFIKDHVCLLTLLSFFIPFATFINLVKDFTVDSYFFDQNNSVRVARILAKVLRIKPVLLLAELSAFGDNFASQAF